jgi:hypothetical protein
MDAEGQKVDQNSFNHRWNMLEPSGPLDHGDQAALHV